MFSFSRIYTRGHRVQIIESIKKGPFQAFPRFWVVIRRLSLWWPRILSSLLIRFSLLLFYLIHSRGIYISAWKAVAAGWLRLLYLLWPYCSCHGWPLAERCWKESYGFRKTTIIWPHLPWEDHKNKRKLWYSSLKRLQVIGTMAFPIIVYVLITAKTQVKLYFVQCLNFN